MKMGINHSSLCYMYLRALQFSGEMLFKASVKRLNNRSTSLDSVLCVHTCVCAGMHVLGVDPCIDAHSPLSLFALKVQG